MKTGHPTRVYVIARRIPSPVDHTRAPIIYNDNGRGISFNDGCLSFSQYGNPKTGDSGHVINYEWRIVNSIFSGASIFSYHFEVVVSSLNLLVEDQTGDRTTATTEINVFQTTVSDDSYYY